jgi:hypothetical protein
VRRIGPPALLVGIGLVLLADFLVLNPTLSALAGFLLELVVLVAAGAALAGAASLAVHHGLILWRRRGQPLAAVAVLAGIAAMLIVGLRPGSAGAADPATRWLVAALLIPLGASLFGLLFVSTLTALRRAAGERGREPLVLAGAAFVALLLLVPLGGVGGVASAGVATWALEGPIGAVFRGLLLGIGLVSAVAAARTLLGIGPADD